MRLIDADKLVEDLTKAAEISEKTFSDSEKIVEIFEVEPYELYKFPTNETTKDIKNKLFNALEKDDKLLELVYKFYQVVK